MKKFVSLLILTLVSTWSYANVPEECIQSPLRENLCPHTLYRKAQVAVPALGIPAGDMVCLCLSDLTDLPVDSQPQAFADIAREYDLSTLALFHLLELTPPDWASQK